MPEANRLTHYRLFEAAFVHVNTMVLMLRNLLISCLKQHLYM